MTARSRLLIALLLSSLMMSGCVNGESGADGAQWSMPLVVSDSAARCPEPDPGAMREFKRTTPPPAADTVTADGTPAVSVAAWKQATDNLRLSEMRKNRAGRRVIEDYQRCRMGPASVPQATS